MPTASDLLLLPIWQLACSALCCRCVTPQRLALRCQSGRGQVSDSSSPNTDSTVDTEMVT